MFNCIFELLELYRVCQVIVFFLSSRNRKPLSEAETFIGNKSIFFNLFIRKEELDKLNERESVYICLELEKSKMQESVYQGRI